jgi:hypothetical protein
MRRQHRDECFVNRRVFLRSGIILAGATFAGAMLMPGAEREKEGGENEIPVGPPEDLMREHGVVKRYADSM